ncbi:MAG: hypothetical protein ACFFAE_12560, partial [Candidatus Hodarchaeota archaeon]
PDMAIPLYNSTYNYGWAAAPGDDVHALQSLELTYNGSYIYRSTRPVGDPIYRPTMADLYEFEWPTFKTKTETKELTITITETKTETITEKTSDLFGITAILGMVAVIVVVRRRK